MLVEYSVLSSDADLAAKKESRKVIYLVVVRAASMVGMLVLS